MKKLEKYKIEEIKKLLLFDFLVYNQGKLKDKDVKRFNRLLEDPQLVDKVLYSFVEGDPYRIMNHTTYLRKNIQFSKGKQYLEKITETRNNYIKKYGEEALKKLVEEYLDACRKRKIRFWKDKKINTNFLLDGVKVRKQFPKAKVYQ